MYEPWSFCILTFGCKVNQYESQSVREAWRRMSGVETDAPAEADVVLLNTCAVTANAVADARQAVRRLRRDAPGVPVVIAGCAAEVARRELSALPGVLCVLEQDHKSRLLDAPPLVRFGPISPPVPNGGQDVPEKPFPSTPAEALARVATRDRTFPPFHIDGFRRARPVLKVQDGCSQGCAYCIVPLTRGPARSRDPRECLAELRRLLEAGYREIMLSGINLRQYAMRDAGCRDFWDLLAYLDGELAPEWGSGVRSDPARLRISSVEPAQLTERGIAILAQTRMVCPHLHLSLQSGSADVLKAMRRGHYTPEGLLKAVGEVAGLWPRFGLGADILMGFPGETEGNVLETLEVVRALPLTYAHVFPYSVRPGTVAAGLPDQIGKAERQERAARVRAIVEVKREAFWKASLDGERLVALDCNDGSESGGQHGVDECYVPCRLRTPVRGAGHTLIAARPVCVTPKGLSADPVGNPDRLD